MAIRTTQHVERVKTGIEGLDNLIEGGFPEGSFILLTGPCGTGKTILGMNFLMEGLKNGEPGIYVSLEELYEENVKQMRNFGWDVDKYVANKQLLIVKPELYKFDALIRLIEDSIEKIKAKRLVIDSISLIGLYFENPYKVRKAILELGNHLRKIDCTTVAIDEVNEGSKNISSFGVEEFVSDGVIIVYYILKDSSFTRGITVRKMRMTRHSKKIHPLHVVSGEGIVVDSDKSIYGD